MSSSGHPAGLFSADCTLKSWPWRFWVIHVWVFSGSPSGSECGVLCFVMVTLCFGTSLAPRLVGFTVPARSARDKSYGRPL